jgi:hypothetical protein
MTLGPQFQRLYRGLYGVSSSEVGRRDLGAHWTTDPNIAYNYATGRDVEGNPPEYDEESPMSGTVVSALVHRRHIVDPESKEGQGWQDFHAVLGPDHVEREKTVRPGSIVHVQEMIDVDDDADTTSIEKMSGRGWRA